MSPNGQLAMFADLTWQDLEEWAGTRVVRRGKSYKTRVLKLYTTDGGGLLGTVVGTSAYTTLAPRSQHSLQLASRQRRRNSAGVRTAGA